MDSNDYGWWIGCGNKSIWITPPRCGILIFFFFFFYKKWILERYWIATCFHPLIPHKRFPWFNPKLQFGRQMSTKICTLSLTGCWLLLSLCAQQSIQTHKKSLLSCNTVSVVFFGLNHRWIFHKEIADCTKWLSVRRNIAWWPNNADLKQGNNTVLVMDHSLKLK